MFFTRLFSGIILVLIALVTIITGGALLSAVLLMISIVAFIELTRATKVENKENKLIGNGLEIIGIIGIVGYYFGIYFLKGDIIVLTMLISVFLAFMFLYVITFPKYHVDQVMAAFFSFIYAPIMLAFIYLTRDLHYGNYIVWLIFISSWGCDTCAYAVGMAFGKTIGNHKIFPVLSPKKSLEGCIGGVVGAMLIGAAYGHFFMEKVILEQEVTWIVAIICGVGAIFSQIGDLAASAIKRNHEIKDYGKLIPGHGGIMDRFDSVIVTAPLIYLLTRLFITGALVK